MTDTEATAAAKPELTPEQQAQRQANRVIARALSGLEEGSAADKKARWGENKAKYTGEARKLVRALTKDGISFVHNAENAKKGKRGGGKKGKKDDAAGESAED